jgi:RNA polymerase sigma-70 factor (ECF subfamily)
MHFDGPARLSHEDGAKVTEPDVQEVDRLGPPARDFEEFFLSTRVGLYRALVVVTRDTDQADDLAQEAFCRALERWDRVSKMENPEGYVYRIALNQYFQAGRRIARTVTRAIRPATGADPMEVAESTDSLQRDFLGLTPRQRAALLLTAVMGYTSREAAAVMGVRAGTVRRLASQGAARLRVRLEAGDE